MGEPLDQCASRLVLLRQTANGWEIAVGEATGVAVERDTDRLFIADRDEAARIATELADAGDLPLVRREIPSLMERVMATVRKAGGEGVTARAVYRAVDCRADAVEAILTDLQRQGRVRCDPIRPATGRHSARYTAAEA